jgi:hypothetical protein
VLGDGGKLTQARKVVLLPTSSYRDATTERTHARITRNHFELSFRSEPFIEEELLLPAGAVVTEMYNQERGLIQDPLASSRIVLGEYEQQPFLHLSYRANPSVTISDLETLVDQLNTGASLSTQVLTEGYHFRTNIVSAAQVISTESTGDESFGSVYSSPQEFNFHATKSLDRVIITNLPTNQDLFTSPVSSSDCLPSAHSYSTGPASGGYLLDRLLADAHQSKRTIRSCF